MSALTEIEVLILIDENGDYAVHDNPNCIKGQYEKEIGEIDGSIAYRLVRLTVKVPTPVAATATIIVPALANDATVTMEGGAM